MPDDPLTTDTPPVTSRREDGPRELICGGCGCKLARSGEILTTGESNSNYKKFLKHDQILEAKDREISARDTEIAALKARIQELEGQPQPARRAAGALVTKST